MSKYSSFLINIKNKTDDDKMKTMIKWFNKEQQMYLKFF